MEFDSLSHNVIGCAIEVHKELGPGLLESSYHQCLAYELSNRKINFILEKPLPVMYKGQAINCEYRIDIIVEDKLIIEVKSVEKMIPLYDAQILTYMRMAEIQTGLLINLNVLLLKDGIKRFILSSPPSLSSRSSRPSRSSYRPDTIQVISDKET
jgi:GxxExxY protein